MPLVMISRSPRISDDFLREIIVSITESIAKHLNTPEQANGLLKARDMSVRVQDASFDPYPKDLEVIIMANEFEARILTGQDRSDSIAADIYKLLPSELNGFVWILLTKGFFTTFGN